MPDTVWKALSTYVGVLLDEASPTGLIRCLGCDAPFNTKPENMETSVAVAHKFGKV